MIEGIMTPQEVTICVVTGCLLIVFGLVPGVYQGLVEGVIAAIHQFRDQISSGLPTRVDTVPVQKPTWLAGLGALLIVLSVLGYFSN